MAKHEPVVFEDSRGNKISNDPVWLAEQTLKNAKAAMGAEDPTASAQGTDKNNELIDTSPYADMDGKALKAAASDKGVDITGLKTVGEVKAALIAFDEKTAADAEAAKAAPAAS